MSFHLLELVREDKPQQSVVQPASYQDLRPLPRRYPGFASSSILLIRPWTCVGLNEGSFLKAYGTYEYFERGPPSLVYSINQCFMPSHPGVGNSGEVGALHHLRSFIYTGIFPFSNHAVFTRLLPHLEELDVSLAPDVQSGILDNTERVGKAVLEDCWQELISVSKLRVGRHT